VTSQLQRSHAVLERGAEVADHAELGEDDRAFWVAVEALDLAVGQLEDVAAGCVHRFAGRRQRPGGQVQRAEMGSLQGRLDHHDVAADVELVQLAVPVRERPRVVFDLFGEFAGAAPGDPDGLIGKGAVVGEGRDPSLEVLVLGDLVGLRTTCSLSRVMLYSLIVRSDGSKACRLARDRSSPQSGDPPREAALEGGRLAAPDAFA
jgi:hypothetical protein